MVTRHGISEIHSNRYESEIGGKGVSDILRFYIRCDGFLILIVV